MLTVAEENVLPLARALAEARGGDETLAAFYAWIGRTFALDAYDEIRRAYGDGIDPKFLAVCSRTRRLMPVAKWLSWHETSNLRTLDLGSGAGHMGLVASYFGHDSVGVDCCPIFDRLREFWGQTAINHRIEAHDPLPPLGRFHSITSILTNYGRSWTAGEWDRFVDRVTAHLEPGGEFVLHFPGDPRAGNRRNLHRRATRIEGERFMFFTGE